MKTRFTRQKKQLVLFLGLGLFLYSMGIKAQVTIGSGEEANAGSLLQLKSETGVTGGGANSSKGFNLPRVNMTSATNLYPMFLKDPSDPDSGPSDAYASPAGKASIDNAHKGLMVYNINNTAPFKEGIYIWGGGSWGRAGGSSPWLVSGSTDEATASTDNMYRTGQVTIGGNVKSTDAVVASAALNVDATNKGVLLPRVALTSATDVTTVPNPASGLLVYNTGISTSFPEAGFVYWNADSTKWKSVATPQTVENALTLTNTGAIQLGGKLKETKTTIDLDTKTLVFDNSKSPTYVEGAEQGLVFKELRTVNNATSIVVDKTSGRVGLSPVIPALLFFYQSSNEDFVTGRVTNANASIPTLGTPVLTPAGDTNADAINAYNTFIIPWNEATDSETNNLLDPVSGTNSFTVKSDLYDGLGEGGKVKLELSGYIGFVANANEENASNTDPNGANANGPANTTTIVNASIQVKKKSEGTFKNLTSMRGVYAQGITYYRQTLSIPPAIYEAEKGDEMRMVVVIQPRSQNSVTGSTSSLGANHQRPKIVKPYGTEISKAFKVIAQ